MSSGGQIDLETGALRVSVVGGATDAATAAKQPALGTAGTPSTDVITVQGITSGTPQPITGGVAAGVADSGNPVKIGGVGSNATPTAVTNGHHPL